MNCIVVDGVEITLNDDECAHLPDKFIAEITQQGWNDYNSGKEEWENPYQGPRYWATDERSNWIYGWFAARAYKFGA